MLLLGVQDCHALPGPWPLWQACTQRFLDDQGRVIDRAAGNRATSEGQACAVFFALVDNDRARFEKLLRWHSEAPVGSSAALVPFREASGMKSQARLQHARLIAAPDPLWTLRPSRRIL